MFKTKKFLLLTVVALMAVMVLAACNSDAGNSSDGKDGGESVFETIKKRDKIVFGVKYDTKLFGLKNPSSGEVEGFDIDVAKQLAKEILGDETKVEFVEVTSKTRIPLLNKGDIDAIIATMTIT